MLQLTNRMDDPKLLVLTLEGVYDAPDHMAGHIACDLELGFRKKDEFSLPLYLNPSKRSFRSRKPALRNPTRPPCGRAGVSQAEGYYITRGEDLHFELSKSSLGKQVPRQAHQLLFDGASSKNNATLNSQPASSNTSNAMRKPARKAQSGEAKVFISSRHGGVEILPQRLVTLILREVELVEASVGAGQAVLIAVVLVHAKAREAVHALELLEPVERHLARASDKLEQLGALLLVEGADGAPEPLDLRGRGGVIVVLGIVLPIVDVDVGHAGDEEFEFAFVEDGDELCGDDVVEALEVVSKELLTVKERVDVPIRKFSSCS